MQFIKPEAIVGSIIMLGARMVDGEEQYIYKVLQLKYC